jgi:hypothetical protein
MKEDFKVIEPRLEDMPEPTVDISQEIDARLDAVELDVSAIGKTVVDIGANVTAIEQDVTALEVVIKPVPLL